MTSFNYYRQKLVAYQTFIDIKISFNPNKLVYSFFFLLHEKTSSSIQLDQYRLNRWKQKVLEDSSRSHHEHIGPPSTALISHGYYRSDHYAGHGPNHGERSTHVVVFEEEKASHA